MKYLNKAALLFASLGLLLTSCVQEPSCYCLETSDSPDLVEGYAYQVSYRDISESIYIINPALNPEADPNEQVYDLSWNMESNLDLFACIGGLSGKKIRSINRLSDNILKVNIYHHCADQTATFGYIKINPKAFTCKSDRTRDAYLYAYVAIGEKGSTLVEKPADIRYDE